ISLEGCTLQAELTADSADIAATLTLASPALQVANNDVISQENPPRAIASILATQSPRALQVRLLPGAAAADLQSLLRALSIQIDRPIDHPVTFDVRLHDAAGTLMSEAKA